jgi:anti-sigma28 factor (negative regulator of flagellin synthesis)
MNNNKDLKLKNDANEQKAEQKASTKVEALKQLVADGEYKVDLNKTAEAMLNEFIR